MKDKQQFDAAHHVNGMEKS